LFEGLGQPATRRRNGLRRPRLYGPEHA